MYAAVQEPRKSCLISVCISKGIPALLCHIARLKELTLRDGTAFTVTRETKSLPRTVAHVCSAPKTLCTWALAQRNMAQTRSMAAIAMQPLQICIPKTLLLEAVKACRNYCKYNSVLSKTGSWVSITQIIQHMFTKQKHRFGKQHYFLCTGPCLFDFLHCSCTFCYTIFCIAIPWLNTVTAKFPVDLKKIGTLKIGCWSL